MGSSLPPISPGDLSRGLHVIGASCLHSRDTESGERGGICQVWGLDKGFTLTLLAASLTTVSPTVQPTAPGISPITWIAARVLTIFVIMGIVACIHYKKRY